MSEHLPEHPGRPLAHGMLTEIKAGIVASFPRDLTKAPNRQGYATVLARFQSTEVQRAVVFTPITDLVPPVIQEHMGEGHTHPCIMQCFDLRNDFINSMIAGKFPSSPLGDGLCWLIDGNWRTSCTPDGAPIAFNTDSFGEAVLHFAAVHCGLPVTSTGPEVEA